MTEKKKKGVGRKIIIALLILLALVLAAGGGLFLHYWSLLGHEEESLAILESIEEPEEPGNPAEESRPQEESSDESGGGSVVESEEDSEIVIDPVVDWGDTRPWDGSTLVRSSRSYVSGCEPFSFINMRLNYQPKSLKGEGIINILLVGMDTRPNWSYGRSDVMILCTVNKNTQEISLTSLARDTYLILKENTKDSCVNRLNAAAAFGGVPYLVRTVERTYDIYIDFYVQTTFGAFATAVDDMGGLDLNLSAAEAKAIGPLTGHYSDYSGVSEKLEERDGMAHLSGDQALGYCRLRSIDNDFGRTNRQRKTLVALIGKAKTLSWGELDAIATRTLPRVNTNMSVGQFMSLLSDAYNIYRSYSVKTYCLPVEGTYSWCWSDGGRWIIQMDFAKNIQFFYENVYHKTWDGK